jgi:lipid-binding SYLF domain-containing protein
VVPGDKTEIDAEWYIDTSVAAAKIGKKDRVNYLSETLREHVLGFILTADYLTADASLKGSKLLKVGF